MSHVYDCYAKLSIKEGKKVWESRPSDVAKRVGDLPDGFYLVRNSNGQVVKENGFLVGTGDVAEPGIGLAKLGGIK